MKSRLDDYCPEFKQLCKEVACVARSRVEGYIDKNTGEGLYIWLDENSKRAIIVECTKFGIILNVIEGVPCKN